MKKFINIFAVCLVICLLLVPTLSFADDTSGRGTSQGSRSYNYDSGRGSSTGSRDTTSTTSGRVSDANGKSNYMEEEDPNYVETLSEIYLDNFSWPVNGENYSSDAKLARQGIGTITTQQFKINGKTFDSIDATAGEKAEFYVLIELNDGFAFADKVYVYLDGETQDYTIKNDSMGENERAFVWEHTAEYTDKIKITSQSSETLEYADGEDAKLFVKATGANGYQWTMYETRSVGRKTVSDFYSISGATKNEYTIKSADGSYDGKQFRCTLFYNDATIYSEVITLKLVEKKAEETTETQEEQTTEEEKVITYEVYFETNGGNKIDFVEVKAGEKISKPANPQKDGFTFDGWYTNKKLTKSFDFNTAINDDLTLYAKWIEKEEEVTTVPKEKTWIKASTWAEEELDKANEMDIIPNKLKYADLTWNITRTEFAHVAVRLYEKLTGNKAIPVANNPFIDTSDEEVLKAYNLGITNGTSDVTFNPNDLITREQMATMMTRALSKSGINTTVDLEKVEKFVDDNEMHDWGRASVYYMSSIGIIKGVGNNTFSVLGNATREQALLISERSTEKFSK